VPLASRRGRGRPRTRLRGRASLRWRPCLRGGARLLRRRGRRRRLLGSRPVVLRERHRDGRRGRGRPGRLRGRGGRRVLRGRPCRRRRRSLAVGGAPGRGRRLRHRAVRCLRFRCLLRSERFLEPSHDGRLDRRGRRPYELAHFLELGHHGLALDPELLRELVHPNLRHCAPSTWPGLPGPSHRPGQRVLRTASACAVHRRILIGRSSQSRPSSLLATPARYSASFPSGNAAGRRRARGNARRRWARPKHSRLGCRYAPRPGSRAATSGTISSPVATTRMSSDLAARTPHPTHVRIGDTGREATGVRPAFA
jgi:hypothetical protein